MKTEIDFWDWDTIPEIKMAAEDHTITADDDEDDDFIVDYDDAEEIADLSEKPVQKMQLGELMFNSRVNKGSIAGRYATPAQDRSIFNGVTSGFASDFGYNPNWDFKANYTDIPVNLSGMVKPDAFKTKEDMDAFIAEAKNRGFEVTTEGGIAIRPTSVEHLPPELQSMIENPEQGFLFTEETIHVGSDNPDPNANKSGELLRLEAYLQDRFNKKDYTTNFETAFELSMPEGYDADQYTFRGGRPAGYYQGKSPRTSIEQHAWLPGQENNERRYSVAVGARGLDYARLYGTSNLGALYAVKTNKLSNLAEDVDTREEPSARSISARDYKKMTPILYTAYLDDGSFIPRTVYFPMYNNKLIPKKKTKPSHYYQQLSLFEE